MVSTILLVFIVLLSLLFNVYIIERYLLTSPRTWRGASRFYDTHFSTVSIGIHFIGGITVNALGALQLVPRIRRRHPAWHRWGGHVYLVGATLACLGGLMFIVHHGCFGRTEMNIAFGIYGTAFLLCAWRAYYAIRVRRDVANHRKWAIRAFALGIGSALYRIYIVPLRLREFTPDEIPYVTRYLNTAAWLMFVPNAIFAEIYILYTRRSVAGATASTPADDGGRRAIKEQAQMRNY